jgi:uncharacterized repeat protein (TIGR01451 family)
MRYFFFLGILTVSHFLNSQISTETIDNVIGSTSNLNGIYIVPNGVLSIKVQCWGGGGSGGVATGQAAAGGGGSGGAYVEKVIAVTPGQTFNYSVGNGGNGFITSTNRNGGDTWFGSSSTLLAKGGLGGVNATLNFSTVNGASAVTSGNIGGTISYYGGAGGTGTYGANGSQAGGGGGSAGADGNGQAGQAATGGIAGLYGGNGASAGTWQLPLNCNCNGNVGSSPGGGGSGGQSSDPADNQGGHGGVGRIVITEIKPGIGGYIYKDINANCNNDNENGLRGIKILVEPGSFITETDNNGNWNINNLPIGTYTYDISSNLYPMIACNLSNSISVTEINQFYSFEDVGIYNLSCPILDVSVYAPTLRRCFNNQKVFVNVCNNLPSTTNHNNSYVEVDLDNLLTLTSATLPFTALGNNIFRFETGDLNPGQCVSFNISTTVSCNALNGQTLCMDATLYPIESCALDTIPTDPTTGGGGTGGTSGTLNGLPQPCLLPWDQSSLSVDGWCANDSIYFTITNTGEFGGGDMECYSPMWITVDGVVTYTDSIMIQGGQTLTLSFPGDGQTWILNAEQHPLHPGNSHPNAHVEACGDTTNWTPDIVNDFPQDDADPVVDIYCGVVTGSFDPNDKTGYPIGQTEQFYIQPNQQMQYVIRFQNTGTDTAFTVVIRDTLETDLDIFTVTPGVSSHNYEFRMYGPRVLEWTFNNILLPDSTTNSEASNGFVTFHVDQVNDLAPGTEITNDADIYFDFNDPITTNTTIHRIFEGFVSVLSIEELINEGKTLLVYPNPATNNITIKGKEFMTQHFKVYDQMGREVLNGKLNGISTEVNLSKLSDGIYTLKIEGNYKTAQIVKQ